MSFVYGLIVAIILGLLDVHNKTLVILSITTMFFHHYCIASHQNQNSYNFDDYFIETLLYYKETLLQKIGLHKPIPEEISTLKNLREFKINILNKLGAYSAFNFDNLYFALVKHYQYFYRVRMNDGNGMPIYYEYYFIREIFIIYLDSKNDSYWNYMGLERKYIEPYQVRNEIKQLVEIALNKKYITEQEANRILNYY